MKNKKVGDTYLHTICPSCGEIYYEWWDGKNILTGWGLTEFAPGYSPDLGHKCAQKFKLLDLFSGGGGAGEGYRRAGFEVTGVDNAPQPKNPHNFIQADAFEYLEKYGHLFDLIHASPPCQGYSKVSELHGKKYPRFIAPIRDLLKKIGRPYIIENVETANKDMENPILLCGTMFGLLVVRHRCFESSLNLSIIPLRCNHFRPVVPLGRRPDRVKHYHSVVGHFSDVEFGKQALGIDWLGQKGLAQAIPPAYTEWIGRQAKEQISCEKPVGQY